MGAWEGDSGGSSERKWFGVLEFAKGATLLNWWEVAVVDGS